MHRKQQNQQNRKPKIGDGNAHLRQAHECHVACTVMTHGRKNPDAKRNHCCQQHRHHSQRHSDGKTLKHQVQHGRAVGKAVAQFTGKQTTAPREVALNGRAIQPQLGGECIHRFRRRVWSHENLGGVAWQYLQHQKHDKGGSDQRTDQRGEAFEEKQAHSWR